MKKNHKTLLAAISCLLTVACLAQELREKPETSANNQAEINLSKLKQDKLLAVFEEIQNRLFVLTNGVIIQAETPRYMSGKNNFSYQRSRELAETDYRLVRTEIVKVFSDDKYMIMQSGKVMLQIQGDTSYKPKQRIYGLAIISGVYDYTTDCGAPISLPKWTLISQSKPTFEQFVAALKAGASFTCWLANDDRCEKCKGFGFTNRTDGKLGKMKCEQCNGTGKIAEKYVYCVKW